MKSIGELYFSTVFFTDEESKTIGQPLLGSNIETIFKNRRGAKGKLTSKGREILEYIETRISVALGGVKVKASWDKHCGCSMCPCSPGYRIKADIPFTSKDDTRFNMWVDSNGEIEYRIPQSKWVLGYDNHQQLDSTFNNK
jgi:hypothetical protein